LESELLQKHKIAYRQFFQGKKTATEINLQRENVTESIRNYDSNNNHLDQWSVAVLF